ncbi:MAG: peptidylprolyl isomerase [Candidatus Accumulibacter sp.]|uniref:peptidylprolyl isomerase n=1 Tax=Accumulibacter sp. TaxID=2053492 RepID=UPI0019D83769|nr:peptidylprolyl isomerase [Accumulibacter sp.]MBE2258431.1 peptidylprolyl isomerase [Paracoccaceae bacterium]MCB1942501.1 peptidylprolyl isomerase [Accumulibacter sp.]MCP5247501.1 peptidylprolyl isomerase [Accumulibacter sp.]
MIHVFRTALLFACLVGLAAAQTSSRPASQPLAADRIVAVVNDEVITHYELRSRLDSALAQLQRQGTSLPPRSVLESQMLERLVMDKVQLQFAREVGLRVDDAQLDQALQRIAANNKLSLPQFRAALEKDGIAFANFREEIRAEMTIARLREREVDSRIFISESEIDNYLAGASGTGNSGEEYQIAHILLRAPESASPEQIQQLRAKTEQVVERLKKGEDFAQLAAAYSDAPDGLHGGDLGWRSLDRLPAMFAEVGGKLQVGQVSPVLRSSNGFHLIKLLGKRGGGAMPAVQQTHARHILIKVNELVSEPDARHKLESLRERIKHGESFAELARLYSQDGSASKGGDLGWIYPGDTVPEFEQAMNRLAPGELSGPVQSPFGFHLIEVLDRRVQDVSSDRQRAAARQTLRDRKRDEAYQDWLRQARDRAYVELRLEER